MAVTLPIVLAAVSDFGATTPLELKIWQTRPLFLAILKSRKPLVRPALPDAVNRAEGSFMTPALYPAPRSQGDEVCTLCRKLAAEAEGESRPQRLTAGQTAPGYPSPSPGVKAAHRTMNSRKGEPSAPSFQRVEAGAVTWRCRSHSSVGTPWLGWGSSEWSFLALGASATGGVSLSLQM